jgi:hypothetical protein
MNAKSTVAMVFVSTIASLVLVAEAEEKTVPQSPNAEASIRAATNIVFRKINVLETNKVTGLASRGWKEFTVSDPSEVRHLASSVHLGVERDNQYEFVYQVAFQGPAGSIEVQLSKNDFVVVESPNPNAYKDHTYPMPKEFYAEFRKLAREQHWEVEAR